MALRSVLRDSFTLLREEPVVFLPKLVSSLVGAIFWLYLLAGLTDPTQVSPERVRNLLIYTSVLIPFDTWIYNSYFIIVRQHQAGEVRMLEALKDGFRRLPQGLVALVVPLVLSTLVALPGIIGISVGLVTGNGLLLAGGLAWATLTTIVTTVVFYFSPAAVVLGDSLVSDFREGISRSLGARREVLAMTLLSVGLLAVAFLAEGALGRLGQIGFVLGRMASGVVTVYLIVVNPELFLSLEG